MPSEFSRIQRLRLRSGLRAKLVSVFLCQKICEIDGKAHGVWRPRAAEVLL